MQHYHLTGYYYDFLSPKWRGELLGKIKVKKDGSFEDEITNSSSKFPNQSVKIKGRFHKKKGLINLFFTESQLDPELAKTKLQGKKYSLEKKSDGNIRGVYEGYYSVVGGMDKVEISIF